MLLLVGYVLLFPPLFVLGPLAGLLAASQPRTLREWAWIAAAVLWLGVSLWEPGGLAPQMVHAWALFVTAAFVALMLPGRRPFAAGALLATVFGLGMATAWIWLLGTRWLDIQLAVAHDGWAFCRQLLAFGQAAAGLSPERIEGFRASVSGLAELVGVAADLLPGMLVLTVLPGLGLAWAWYHRLAARPVGTQATRFADFRFTDQLIWAVVLCVALFVLPTPEPVQDAAANVALVVGGLYAARGAAVAWAAVEHQSGLVRGLLVLVVLFLPPVALGGFFALGLADTWVDFRRRLRAIAS